MTLSSYRVRPDGWKIGRTLRLYAAAGSELYDRSRADAGRRSSMHRGEQERTSITVEDLLAVFPEDVARIVRVLRAVVHEIVPDATEVVYPAWKLIAYRRGHAFGFISPLGDHVRFGFEHGTELPDPERRLESSGSQVRFLRVRSVSEMPGEYLRGLLKLAAAPRSSGGGKTAR